MRVRSLDKDRGDWNQLRNHRMEHVGFSVSNEFYQHSPFFWNREGCELQLAGHYRGASIFFLCNGPSIVNGNYDLSLLKRPGIMTYGINNGPRTIRPNIWTCVDDPQRFMKSIWLDPCITKIVPHSFMEKRFFDNEKWEKSNMVVGQCPNVIGFHRNEKFAPERWLFEDTVNWGNSGDNGGGRSVMLASLKIMFLLGFRNVFLMGADFKMTENYTYHFDEQRHKGAVNGNMSTYDKLQNEFFPALKPHFDAEGFHVYNCNPDSNLKVFDFIDYNKAISIASANLGDVENERTWGMYSKPDERQKWKQEPSAVQKTHLDTIKNKPKVPVFIDMATQPKKVQAQVEQRQQPQQPQQIQKPIVKAPQIPMARPKINVSNIPNIPMATKPVNTPIVPKITAPLDVPKMDGDKIIKSKPCGNIMAGSSSFKPVVPPNNAVKNITIPDNGR